MADLTITVAIGLNLFGAAPSSKWNEINWGDNWGFGTNTTLFAVEKAISENQAIDVSVSKESAHLVASSLGVDSETGSETLTDGSGYSYLLPRPTTEAEDRIQTTFSDVSEPTTSFSSATEPTTNWSES